MPIISVTRWQINPKQAQQLVREAAPRLREHGAQSVTVGMIRTGTHAGQTILAVTYQNWEDFGEAMEALRTDSNYEKVMDQIRENGHLQDRTILTAEEI